MRRTLWKSAMDCAHGGNSAGPSFYGHPANMDGIFLAAQKHGLWVVED